MNHHHAHYTHRQYLILKTLMWAIIILATILVAALIQSWMNAPARFCGYDHTANTGYKVYNCRGETDYVPVNQ